MKLLPQWIASVLTIGVFLSLSFCGAMMSASVSAEMAHETLFVDAMQCAETSCTSQELPCGVQCLQRFDRSQQRLVAEMISLVAVMIIVVSVLVRDHADGFANVFSAPPWRGHRLFALRE